MAETRDLKALADAVLRRDSRRDGRETILSHGCATERPRRETTETATELPADLLADLFDADVRADLAWIARGRPAIVRQLVTLETLCDDLAWSFDRRAYGDACRGLVEAVRRLCRESRLMQQLPN